jgi:hypothetical protein
MERTEMTDEQIKYMVDRFLGWTLPENFYPDGGISFKRLENRYHHPEASPFYPMPSGTNVLDAEQATAMVRHMVEGLPPSSAGTIEAEFRAAVVNLLDNKAETFSVRCQRVREALARLPTLNEPQEASNRETDRG